MAKSWERTAAQILPVATGLWPVQTKLAFTRNERLTEPWLQDTHLYRHDLC